MKKKILLIAVLALLLCSTTAFATGIGIQGGLDFAGTPYASNLALSLKLPDLPFVLGLGWNFQNQFAMGASADWWMYDANLTGIVDIYMGPGIFGGFSIANSNTDFWFGGRLVAGLQVFPIDPLEVFLELDPFLTFIPSPQLGFQGAFGVRFWF